MSILSIEELNIDLKVLQKDVTDIKDKVNDISSLLKEHIEKSDNQLREYMDSIDKRYASKWVEDGIKWAIYLIIGGVITTLLTLVLRK